MHLRTHLEIGLAALSRGYVELQRLADAVAELHREDPGAGTDFWLRPGLMTRRQLDDVLAAVANGSRFVLPSTEAAEPQTLAFGDSPTVNQREGAASSSSSAETATGTRGGDRYTELAVLGAGGMGAIVECMDRELGRRVALKLLKPEFLDDATAARMLEREARVTGSLEHPNIVPVYDIGSTPRGGPFYVMRLVEQPTLGEVLIKLAVGDVEATASYTTGRLLRHFIQICETVDYAHSRGVVHCDLKPANVLLGNFGEVLVLDWGLAYRSLEGTSYRGGTPGYMAPEQLDETRKSTIDARTDVYALGVILYEMLALESYSESATALIKSKPHAPASVRGATRRPSVRAPSRHIAAELDEICARALDPEPDRRFQSARDVAQAVAAFLEGTREKERRQQRAADLTDEGDRLAGSYFEFLETRPERVAELVQVRAVTAPWEPAERKRALWDEEDRLAITDALGVRTLHAAIASYEQALDEVPGHPAARGGLARLYRAQLERAEERREELDRIYFEELVKYYDDGTVLSSMRAEGRLELEVRPPASVTLAAIEEVDRRLQAVRPQRLGGAPAGGTVSVPLPPGRHVVTVSASGHVVRLPILMRAGRTMRATIDLERTRPEAEEVLVPGGPALLDADGGGLIEVDVPAFFMARFAVTFGEYLEFVASLQADEPLRAVAHVPRGRDGALYWRWAGVDEGLAGFVPARIATWGNDVPRLLRLPVFGIDALSAEAYASWRSRVSGRAYRLATEQEWEKAGRGTDGRLYPWGDRFDASFCKMRQSRPGLPRPEPVGSFPIDESPYGVRDLAGGIAEWVHPLESLDASDATQRVMLSRGGAWSDWSADCSLTARRPYLAVERSSRIGFRLVRNA